MTLPQQIAARAKSIIGSVVQTDYQHVSHIDAAAGIYDCDCNGFVGYVLQQVAPAQYAKITPEPTQKRPRAFVYYGYFAAHTPQSAGGWHRIDFLKDALPGDIIAWRFPTIEVDENTGHVVVVAEAPIKDKAGTYSVKVYDSAAEPHFDDTRGKGAGQFPTGVGSGVIKFIVDAEGRPIAFLFAPPATAEFSYVQIAIGRVEPL
jgi:hypothetical protein